MFSINPSVTLTSSPAGRPAGFFFFFSSFSSSSLKEKLENEEKKTKEMPITPYGDKSDNYGSYINILGSENDIESLKSKIEDIEDRLFRMSTIFIGFIINKQLNADDFANKAKKLIQKNKRYKLCLSSEELIKFDDISVEFSTTST